MKLSGGRLPPVRSGLAIVVMAALAANLTAGAARPSAAKKHAELRWRAHPVAEIPDGYQVAVADVNGDGRPDILALSSTASIVAWFENPSWVFRVITTATHRNISLAPLAQPGSSVRGLALASDFNLDDSHSGGEVWWATPAIAGNEWRLRPIGSYPTSHRLRWANLDGSGRRVLVNAPILGIGAEKPEYNVGAPLTWYEFPEPLDRGHASALDERELRWTPHVIDHSLTVVHAVAVLDWDGDGRDEILTASFEGVHLLESTGQIPELTWTKTRIGEGDQASRPRRGSSEVAAGKVHGRRFFATIEPWHGERVVVYFERKRGELWKRQVIDDSFKDGHALAVADLDGDGSDEIVAGYRGKGTSLLVYQAIDEGGRKWGRQTLDPNMAASCVVIADINGDGRPDIVATGASTGNVVWYENLR
ncbi:MAG: VCBS repeat-containing protein [Acidobacteria bacterium]|nr:VCBS repeat-containing protein [Acidobacteriota bacterium]